MKNQKTIYESQGLVDKDGIQWFDLCDLIVNYVFDLQDGLNSDPLSDPEEESITKGSIEGYYHYVYKKNMPSYIIPDWIGKFTINMINEKSSKGSFLPGKAKLNDEEKLEFIIELNNELDSPELMNNTLVHEFQHAYSYWLQLTKNFRLNNNYHINAYRHAQKGFDTKKYGSSFIPVGISKFSDLVEVNDEIYEDLENLERMILTSFYYTNIDEVRSFIQEFSTDIMHQIKNNIQDIKKDIKQALEFKNDFNNLPKSEQFQSNILNSLSITCYNSIYYKKYKLYYKFFETLLKKNIDEEIAKQVISKNASAIRAFLKISPTKKLIKFDGDASNLIKKIARLQLPKYEKIIKKMEKIFVKLILEIPVK